MSLKFTLNKFFRKLVIMKYSRFKEAFSYVLEGLLLSFFDSVRYKNLNHLLNYLRRIPNDFMEIYTDTGEKGISLGQGPIISSLISK